MLFIFIFFHCIVSLIIIILILLNKESGGGFNINISNMQENASSKRITSNIPLLLMIILIITSLSISLIYSRPNLKKEGILPNYIKTIKDINK